MSEKRKYTEAEKKRLERFHTISDDLNHKGYHKEELTASLLKANIIGSILGLICSLPFIIIYILINDGIHISIDNIFLFYGVFLLVLFLLIVIHELLHGLTWSMYTKHRWKSIEFGVIWAYLTPYCTCKEPLKRNEYLLGLLMPCIILGIIPSIISIIINNVWVLLMGVLMILGAGGDLLVCLMILRHHTHNEAVYLDHPTDLGLVVYERKS